MTVYLQRPLRLHSAQAVHVAAGNSCNEESSSIQETFATRSDETTMQQHI